jgi:hypothetical protein
LAFSAAQYGWISQFQDPHGLSRFSRILDSEPLKPDPCIVLSRISNF